MQLSPNLFEIEENHHNEGSIVFCFPIADYITILDRRNVDEIEIYKNRTISMQGGNPIQKDYCKITMKSGKTHYTLNLDFLKTY